MHWCCSLLSSWTTCPSILCIRRVVVGFLHAHISQQALRCGSCLLSSLGKHLQACSAFSVVIAFLHGHLSRRLCAVVIVDSLLGQHLPICSAFFVVDIVFLHGHLSQEALRCGDCCLSSRIASPSMLCIRSVVSSLSLTYLPVGCALWWLLAIFLDNISQHPLQSQFGFWISSYTCFSASCALSWLLALFLDNISQHALHSQCGCWLSMDIFPSRLCVVMAVGSLLG